MPKVARSGIVVDRIHLRKRLLWMATKLSENMSKLIYQMGRDRENRIVTGKTKLTVTAIFLIDDNWKVFKEYRDIIGKPLRQEELDEVEKIRKWDG